MITRSRAFSTVRQTTTCANCAGSTARTAAYRSTTPAPQFSEQWFERMEPALIREAVQRCGLYARRPGAPYIRAILANWDKQGIHCMEDLQAKEIFRTQTQNHRQAMRPWWQNYQQHSYTEADYEGFYYDPARDFKNG